MPKLPKLTAKDLEIIKNIKASNKAAVKRLQAKKDKEGFIKLINKYYKDHGHVPKS